MGLIPDAAELVWIANDEVAIYDVTDLLPKHRRKRYRNRQHPQEVYVHHSGRLGRPGFEGFRNSARYSVNTKGWPGTPYHYWIPYHGVRDDDGHLVVFQGQCEEARTYHAGTGPNDRAVAVCLQGNSTLRAPSAAQLTCLGALLFDYSSDKIFGHCEAPGDGHAKATCPGSHAMAFVYGVRA